MTTELEAAMASLRSALPDDETDHGHVVIESDAIRSVLAALSTPPADGVREAARKRLDEREEYAEQRGYPTFQDEPSAYLNGFEDGAVFEVRPRGTATPPADDVPEALDAEDVRKEYLSRYSHANVRDRYDADLLMAGFADGAAWAAEVRPRGAVTDTVEPYEYCVVNGLGRGIYMAKTLEKAREGIAKDQSVGPGELRPKRSIVRRRRAGKWETFS